MLFLTTPVKYTRVYANEVTQGGATRYSQNGTGLQKDQTGDLEGGNSQPHPLTPQAKKGVD